VSLDDARAVADAVLFEGYALYPYRPSAPKNQLRWQFGVLAPRAWSESGGGDPWWQETQCVVELGAPGAPSARLGGQLRFLQLRRRTDRNAPRPPWDEGEVREIDLDFALEGDAAAAEQAIPFLLPGATEAQGPVIHQRWPASGVVRASLESVPALPRAVKIRIRVENLTAWALPGAPRDEALRASLLGTHLLLSVAGGGFVSAIDPPDWAAAAVADCRSVRTYPVLAGKPGRRDLMLSAPVILPDHPTVAAESPRDFFDATEIDEILTLRILTLTDDEKREIREADPRLAAMLDSVERLSPDDRARLHGAARPAAPAPVAEPRPSPMQIRVHGVAIGPGSRVRLRPGPRRTDAQDMFLAGLTATVEAVMRDVDDRDCLAVTVDDDPAVEIARWHRRFFYFQPDEVEPLEPPEGAEGSEAP
jgi:hypothetical protein